MLYVSTRGDAPKLDFSGVLLAGLALDGGLYVPESWPVLTASQLDAFASMPYHEVAAEVIWPFVEGSSISRAELDRLTEQAYATFRHPDVVPTRSIGDN